MVINIHITPRERERLIREERQRRRVARILQVRQQANENADKVRRNLHYEKENKMQELRRELRRSVSEKISEVVSEEHGGVRLPLPSDTSSASSTAPTRIPMRTPRRHHHTFTKQDAIRALERGRLAQERLRAQRLAQRKEAMAAIERRRQAAQEANRFHLANPTSR
ncbi:hypothetical protein GCK32_011554 [Trichostrongylus colubriformis]|uniref:Uncharacterized protein n=1 Tax=Trichostrongylus colubriformis TaxID=6319 RepID=A0AAN8FK63_TRICO